MSYYKNQNDILSYAGLHIDDISATTAYMLVDLSDTSNWKHTYTGHIDLSFIYVVINPNATFVGHVDIGFLENVDATDGDLRIIQQYPFDSGITSGIAIVDNINFGGECSFFHCGVQRSFLPVHTDQTAFQTDVNLVGPDGNASYPSGNGDLVAYVTRTSGAISMGIIIGYTSHQ